MRQRPKQASYAQKMEVHQPPNRQPPNRQPRQLTAAPPRVSRTPQQEAIRRDKRPGMGAAEGQMTRFISLDDIPDGLATSPPKDNVSHESYSAPLYSYSEDNVRSGRQSSYASQYSSVREVPGEFHPEECSSAQCNVAQSYAPFAVLRSSPISVPEDSRELIDTEDAEWDDYEHEQAAEYRSPTIKQKATRHEAQNNSSIVRSSNVSNKALNLNKKQILNGALAERDAGCEHRSEPVGRDGLYYSKNPRKVEYRPYTLEQYKSIKTETYVEYGKLKPDLNTEELKAKRANADRVKEFSKNLNSFNRQQIRATSVERKECNSEVVQKTDAAKSAREKAKVFAMQVPKPKVRQNSLAKVPPGKHAGSCDGYGTVAEEYCISEDDGLSQLGILQHIGESSRLQELQMKHGENKKKVDAIKKSLGIAPR